MIPTRPISTRGKIKLLMHARRFASFCLGLWLGAGLLMAWISYEDSRMLDRAILRAGPAADEVLKKAGLQGNGLLHRIAADQSAQRIENWETAQLIFGVLLFAYLLFGTRLGPVPMVGVLLMVVLAAAQRLVFTAELHSMLRAVDPAARFAKKLWVLRLGHAGVDALKYAIGLVLVCRFAFSRRGVRQLPAEDQSRR
jgi:hypothetical protein